MAGYRVLVVEDNPEVRRMVSASIKTLSPEIDVLDIPSAEEALFISASLPLDLVVLDYRLPGMTGIEMVARLKKRRPEAKIILVTGVEDTSTRKQVAEAGAEAFFYKPIEIDAFLVAVKQCLWPDQRRETPPMTHQEHPTTLPAAAPSSVPAVKQNTPHGFRLSVDERLTTLRQQLKAVSTLLVNDAGQVLEVAGNPSQITSSAAVLGALLRVYKAGWQVSEAISGGSGASLQYFSAHRQCIYVVNVGQKHALFVLTAGYFEPEKLSAINHTLQAAARDLSGILANQAAEEQAKQEKIAHAQIELPKDMAVDQETLAGVEQIFANSSGKTVKEQADSYWDSMDASDTTEGLHEKDTLSYDQARDLGLAPEDGEEP